MKYSFKNLVEEVKLSASKNIGGAAAGCKKAANPTTASPITASHQRWFLLFKGMNKSATMMVIKKKTRATSG